MCVKIKFPGEIFRGVSLFPDLINRFFRDIKHVRAHYSDTTSAAVEVLTSGK